MFCHRIKNVKFLLTKALLYFKMINKLIVKPMSKSSNISPELTESRDWWKAVAKRFVNGLVRAARNFSRRRRKL